MSYFDDQEDAWLENDCKGNIEDYDPFDISTWPEQHAVTEPKPRTEAQKARKKRNRAKRRAKNAITRKEVSHESLV